MKENNLELPFEKWIVSFFTSWVSKVIRKMFALSTFQTLVTEIPWGKGHFVFSPGKCAWSKMNYFIHIIYNTLYRHWNHFHNKKTMILYIYYIYISSSSSSSFIYKLSPAHSLFTFVLSIRPWRHTVHFPDGFFLFSLKIKSPLCGGCSNCQDCCLKKQFESVNL